MHLDNKIEWCLKKGKTGGRKHTGVRTVKPNIELCDAHLEKAVHNLNAALDMQRGGKYTDWAISAAFYSMYHSVLALLWLLGYESRNQECSIILLEKLIGDGKINLGKDHLKMLRQLEELAGDRDAKSLREEFQYGVKISVESEVLSGLIGNAKAFVGKARIEAEAIKSKRLSK